MRQGPGSTLTPEEAAKQLAIPVLHVLTGMASPVFPGTSNSRPSRWVTIQIGGRPVKGFLDRPYLVSISREQWENAVVPVLEDERWKIQTPMFRRALAEGRFAQQVRLIEAAIRESFEAAGY